MSDVRDMLGIGGSTSSPPPKVAPKEKDRIARKPEGMSREVFALLSTWKETPDNAVEPKTVVPGRSTFKAKRNASKVSSWSVADFQSSARSDGATFKHWVKTTTEYPDYPFAKFNIKPDVVRYSVAEYNTVTSNDAADSTWDKAQTDALFSLIEKFGLRWHVVSDRCELDPPRPVEELKERYYSIAARILKLRKQQGVMLTPYEAKLSHFTFNIEYERRRKRLLEAQSSRGREVDERERQLLLDIKDIEGTIRQLRSTAGVSDSVSDGSIAALKKVLLSRPEDITNAALEDSITWKDGEIKFGGKDTSAFVPQTEPGVYLQSDRLEKSTGNHNLSNRKYEQLQAMLRELGIPPKPQPTATVCRLYDKLRQDIVKLITLQKFVAKREAEFGINYSQIVDSNYSISGLKVEADLISNKRKLDVLKANKGGGTKGQAPPLKKARTTR